MKLEEHFNTNFCIRQSAFFPPQKDYTEEISQLLVHTLEEMRAKGRWWKKRKGEQVEQKNKYKWDQNTASRLEG